MPSEPLVTQYRSLHAHVRIRRYLTGYHLEDYDLQLEEP